MIHVLSTGWQSPKRERCLMSVRMQAAAHEHHYIEASVQSPARTKLENLHDAIAGLAPDAVVALVDGDDWLLRQDSLSIVQRAHDDGAWVTWGSFEYGDGRPGFARDLDWSRPVRGQDWVTTHLKTFRAGLFQRIAVSDLQYGPCQWIDRADDPAFFYPIIEQAGRERCRFIREHLYVYNAATSWERSAVRDELQHERDMHTLSRSRAPYARIGEL